MEYYNIHKIRKHYVSENIKLSFFVKCAVEQSTESKTCLMATLLFSWGGLMKEWEMISEDTVSFR